MTEIRIIGPGGIINNELAVIHQALLEVGYKVVVNNDHPAKLENQSIINFITNRNKESKSTVTIVMKHEPWGG